MNLNGVEEEAEAKTAVGGRRDKVKEQKSNNVFLNNRMSQGGNS